MKSNKTQPTSARRQTKQRNSTAKINKSNSNKNGICSKTANKLCALSSRPSKWQKQPKTDVKATTTNTRNETTMVELGKRIIKARAQREIRRAATHKTASKINIKQKNYNTSTEKK